MFTIDLNPDVGLSQFLSRRFRNSYLHRVTAILIATLPSAVIADSLPTTLVARTGQDATGVAGATFTSIGVLPRLGPNGHVAFNSSITGGGSGSSNNSGYWVGVPGNLQLAIRRDSINGGADLFSGTTNVGVDVNGTISLWTQAGSPVPINENQQLWSYLPNGNGGGPLLVAQEGQTAAPGYTAGALFTAIGAGHASNNAGAVAFVGSVAGGDATSTTDFGLFTGTPGNLKLVAREGTAAPGATGTSPVFSTTTTVIFDKRINASGQVGFAAAISGAGVGGSNDRALYVWTPSGGNGTLALAAQTGSVAPGTSATIKFVLMDDQPGFNNAGQLAFKSQLTSDVPGELNLVNNSGIWAGAPGNVQLVYRSNTPTPIAGLTFRGPEPSPRINASGQVAFFSLVTGFDVTTANDRVLWITTPSGIQMVAREGSAAPGALSGVNFATLDPIAAINAPGQVAFTAVLTGTGVTTANDRGLWAGTYDNVQLVAREGDVLDLDSGPGQLLKTIQTISFANGFSSPVGSSADAAFNDSGAIAWQAQFTDATTAVFLTSVPGTLTGDYNNNGIVDAGDYVIWRKDPNRTQAQYDAWRANFGKPPGSGAGMSAISATVPEPASVLLLLCSASIASCGRLRRTTPQRIYKRFAWLDRTAVPAP